MIPSLKVTRKVDKLVERFGVIEVVEAVNRCCADYIAAQRLDRTPEARKAEDDQDSILFHARTIGLRTCLERIYLCGPYQTLHDLINRAGTDAVWALGQILEAQLVPDDLLPRRIVVERDGKVLLVDRGSVVEVKPEVDGESNEPEEADS